MPAIIGGAAALGALGSLYSGKKQAKAQQSANALQLEMFNRQMAAQEPWRQAGVGALSDLQSLMADPGSIENTAAYQFRFDEGQKALERNLAARGGSLGGGALRELTRYGQGMASDEFQNQFNRLASLAGLGTNATAQQGAYMGAYGQNAAEGLTGLGNIKASSYLGAGQAIAGGIGDYMNYNLMRDIYGDGGGSAGGNGGGWFGGGGSMKAPRPDAGY